MITSKTENITPAKATEWLNHFNPHNRPLSIKYANRLASTMKSGHWVFNGAPIVFNEDGELVDGQHRLKAIVISGRPMTGLVVRGVEHTAFATIDCNKTRSVGDVLSIRGIPSASWVATAARNITIIRRDSVYSNGGKTAPLRHEVLEVFELIDKERLYAAIRQGQRIRKAVGGSIPMLATCIYLSPKLTMVEDFWEQVETGIGLTKGSVAALLRNYIIVNTRSTHRWNESSQYLIYAKCINAVAEGKSWSRLTHGMGEVPQPIYQIKTRK